MPRRGGRGRRHGRPPFSPAPRPGQQVPSGFEWGYGGSGPAQLAPALCADALGDGEAALAVFQRFKFRVIGGIPRDAPWTLTAAAVRRHCRELAADGGGDRDGA